MPNYTPEEIANAFVDLNGGPLTQMKLQKLVYIAHGWNLVINHEPLVKTQPEAWDNGPVFRSIWNSIRDYGTTLTGKIRGWQTEIPVPNFTAAEGALLDAVWKKYGHLSAQRLSDMTHQPGTPWTEAYFWGGRNTPIENDAIEAHYREIALAGRAKRLGGTD